MIQQVDEPVRRLPVVAFPTRDPGGDVPGEVREGFECGIGIENFNDLKVGDVIECYRTEQVARTLESTAG